MKKKVVADNSNSTGNSIEDYKKDAKRTGILILIFVIFGVVFLLIDIFFIEVFNTFLGALIFAAFILFFIIAFRKIIWRTIRWFGRLIFEGVD